MSAYTSTLPNYRLFGENIPSIATLPFLDSFNTFGNYGWGIVGTNPLTTSPSPLANTTPFLNNAGVRNVIADSIDVDYLDAQTKYGSCNCSNGALVLNNCNYQQYGYSPVCLENNLNCICGKSESDNGAIDSGCYNRKGQNCM